MNDEDKKALDLHNAMVADEKMELADQIHRSITDGASMTVENNPGQWALVELFGRVRVAGYVTIEKIAGAEFLRVDFPEIPGGQPKWQECVIDPNFVFKGEPYYRHYSPAAVYSLTPVPESVARELAAHFNTPPLPSEFMAYYNRLHREFENDGDDLADEDLEDETFPDEDD